MSRKKTAKENLANYLWARRQSSSSSPIQSVEEVRFAVVLRPLENRPATPGFHEAQLERWAEEPYSIHPAQATT